MNERALRREFMARDELLEELRLHGVTDLAEVAWVYLEPNGMVSVIRRETVDDVDEAAPAPRVIG